MEIQDSCRAWKIYTELNSRVKCADKSKETKLNQKTKPAVQYFTWVAVVKTEQRLQSTYSSLPFAVRFIAAAFQGRERDSSLLCLPRNEVQKLLLNRI